MEAIYTYWVFSWCPLVSPSKCWCIKTNQWMET